MSARCVTTDMSNAGSLGEAAIQDNVNVPVDYMMTGPSSRRTAAIHCVCNRRVVCAMDAQDDAENSESDSMHEPVGRRTCCGMCIALLTVSRTVHVGMDSAERRGPRTWIPIVIFSTVGGANCTQGGPVPPHAGGASSTQDGPVPLPLSTREHLISRGTGRTVRGVDEATQTEAIAWDPWVATNPGADGEPAVNSVREVSLQGVEHYPASMSTLEETMTKQTVADGVLRCTVLCSIVLGYSNVYDQGAEHNGVRTPYALGNAGRRRTPSANRW